MTCRICDGVRPIHELGHVFNMLLGAGGSDFIYDLSNDGAVKVNSQIEQDCIRN
jgi:hypothetical protein